MSGILQKFGENPGALVDTDLIASIQVPAGDELTITDFGTSASDASADSVINLQVSNDNFAASIVTISRIEMPTGGTVLKTFETPIKVKAGNYFRLRFSQGTAGTISGELYGETKNADISDI